MKKTISINVPEPCHEGWENMTPTEKGRFCSSCEKEVIDFSNSTDEDLVKQLEGKTNVCGRFKGSQLDRELTLERKSSLNLLPYAASLMLPLSLMSANPIHGTGDHSNYTSLGIGRYSKASEDRIQVTTSGRITNANGKPVFNVEITVKESGRSEVSGLKGDYEIKSLDGETLIFRKEGFVSQEVKLGRISGILDITLKPAPPEIPEVMVLGGIGAIKEIEEVPSDILENAIPIYETESKDELIEGEIILETEDSEEKEKSNDTIVMSGTVIDEYDLPLAGANVLIKGTSTGTQTNFDGEFELNVSPGQTLQFSYVGFETKELRVSAESNRKSIVLLSEEFLGEVVVIGYPIQILGPNYSKYVVAPEEYPESEYTLHTDKERERWRENNKKARANETAFKRIQQARKKAARLLNKHKRKKK